MGGQCCHNCWTEERVASVPCCNILAEERVLSPHCCNVWTEDTFDHIANAKLSNMQSAMNAGQLDTFYELDEELGSGAFGQVWLGLPRNRHGHFVNRAIKSISKQVSKKKHHRVLFEIDILADTSHPNIVKLFEAFEDDEKVHLVTEACTGGNLSAAVVRAALPEEECAPVMRQALNAVSYLHQKLICHRDLKASNIMLLGPSEDATRHLRIVDFGAAKRFERGVPMTTVIGSPAYIAPEVVSGSYSQACDIWSLGILMYFLLCGYLPFIASTDAETVKLVLSGHIKFPPDDWRKITGAPKELIRTLCQRSVQRRLSAAKALQHPWYAQGGARLTGDKKKAFIDAVGRRLSQFMMMSRIKKLVMYMIATQAEEPEARGANDVFELLDTQHTGLLSRSRLGVAVRTAVRNTDKDGEQPPIEDLEDCVCAMVEEESQEEQMMDYWHFLAATLDPEYYMREGVLRAAFNVFDANDRDTMTEEDVSRVVTSAGMQRSTLTSEFHELLEEQDGLTMNFAEFMQMMGEVQAL